LTSPFTGLGTLDVCQGQIGATQSCGLLREQESIVPQAEPYSFTATVTHATSLQVSAPALARRGSSVTVRASVSSPAGTPAGSCLIQKQIAPVAAGQCARRVRLGRGFRQTIGVGFVGNDGWQAASAHRTIRLAR
jgi:hypothetical protein